MSHNPRKTGGYGYILPYMQKGYESIMYKLLIVDDNYYERKGLSELRKWQEMNFDEVQTAQNGEEGIAKALALKPLLVLTDISMPIMDGLTMAKQILEELPETKFIFMSCFDNSEYIRTAIDLDAFGYILKPINLNKLMATVEKVLQISESEQFRLNTIKDLKKQLQENLPLLREQLTRDLLYGEIGDFEEKRFVQFNMQLIRFYAVAELRIDHFEENCAGLGNDEIYLAINQIKRYFDGEAGEAGRVYSFVQNQKCVAVLIYLDHAADENDAASDCLNYLNRVKNRVNLELGITASICIGGISDSFTDIHKLFTKAEYTMSTSICTRDNTVIFLDNAERVNNMLNCDFSVLKSELSALLESGNTDGCRELVNKYYDDVAIVEESIIKEFTLSFISTLQLLLFEMSESLSNIFGSEAIIWEKLSRYNTILDIKQWIFNILKSIVEYQGEKNSSRYAKMANDIKKIIDEQYMNLDNVNQIAEQLYISTVHANFVFKGCFGCTMFDYLTRVRIDKAKEMLSSKKYKVYEVADLLGYKSKTYFASLFKEYTGLTPKEFRDK